ncbi:MAG: tRNA pseudouridine(13) synthase TruD [Holophagales bacterium]|nr:tRNA pseudouridine(13) synthase TruD [Holophagales bacterium]
MPAIPPSEPAADRDLPARPWIRAVPEDFEVEELTLYEPTGSGPFLWLWVEKRQLNTHDVVRILARELGLRHRDVGYAGRKDRRAVTRQAFTVPAHREGQLSGLDAGRLEQEGLRILGRQRHAHRLRTGELAGNRFRLTIRRVNPAQSSLAVARLQEMVATGMPNRFGRQRFGRDGLNPERGLGLLQGEPVRGDRRRAWLMVTALQARVFDRVLERRPHDQLWPGDLAEVHATAEWLRVEDPSRLAHRLAAFELSPTGPLFGRGVRRPEGEVARLEAEVMEEVGPGDLDRLQPPKWMRLDGDRRSLRVRPGNVEHRFDAEAAKLHLAFELPPGAYATVLLEELFPAGYEEGLT